MRYIDATGSESIIRNFMGLASRDTCNEYLYEALKDALEALERHDAKNPLEKHCEDPGEKPYIKVVCPNGCPVQVSKYDNYCNRCGQKLDWN